MREMNEYLAARISHCLQLLTNISDDWLWPTMQFKTTVKTVSNVRPINALFQIPQQNHFSEKCTILFNYLCNSDVFLKMSVPLYHRTVQIYVKFFWLKVYKTLLP